PHLGEWENAIEAGELPAADFETLSPRQRAGELAMLQLRLSRGVEFEDFRNRSGFDARTLFEEPLARFAKAGLLTVTETAFSLTETGVNVADALAAEFVA